MESNRNKATAAKAVAEAFRSEVMYIQYHDIHDRYARLIRWNSVNTIAKDIAFLLELDDPIEFLKECGFDDNFVLTLYPKSD